MEGIKFVQIAEPRCAKEPSEGYAWRGGDEKYSKGRISNTGNYGGRLAEYFRAVDSYGRANMSNFNYRDSRVRGY